MSDQQTHPGDEWGEATVEHEFSTGRTATLRKHINVFAIGTDTGLGVDLIAGSHDPDLTMGHVVLAILRYLWVRPMVLGPGDKAPKGVSAVAFSDVATEETLESLQLWKEAADTAARFRTDAPGTGGGKNSAGVGSGAKPAPRARARKPAGTRR